MSQEAGHAAGKKEVWLIFSPSLTCNSQKQISAGVERIGSISARDPDTDSPRLDIVLSQYPNLLAIGARFSLSQVSSKIA
jgi:hypothetical protein